MSTAFSRRGFSAGAGISILPRHLIGGSGRPAPSDKLNIAGVGVGAMGGVYLRNCESENIVALADVDHDFAAKTFERYPKATRYTDFRVMLEKEKGIDAVVIGTPDHAHAVVAMAAMKLGKAVYCAKPMTRTIHEARLLARTAREQKVATQMSVQSCASEAACETAEWVQAGAAGHVREVHVWSDRPIWPQGERRPTEKAEVPRGLDWDLWLGPAPARPYNPIYHPFRWRGWVDFGTGAIGDMGCHTLHVIYRALNLGLPLSVQATYTVETEQTYEYVNGQQTLKLRKRATPECFPKSSIVTWNFPARGELPPVRVIWYDGGLRPPTPPEMEPGKTLPVTQGILFAGSKGTLFSGFTGGPSLIPAANNATFTPPAKTLPRTVGHYQEWIEAAKGGKPANCNFDFASLITETALLGTIASRTGKLLYWDSENMKFTNDADANRYVNEPYRAGWSL